RSLRTVGRARHRSRRAAPRHQSGAPQGLGHRLVPVLPELHDPGLEAELGADVPLLADVVQHAHLRRDVLLRAPEVGTRATRAGARGRHVQGVRAAGRQHARGDADDARIAHRREAVSAERPGDSPSSSAPHGAQLCGRLRTAGRAMTASPILPAQFADLEPFAAFARPTERERYDFRVGCRMDELQAFYDAAFPRFDEAIAYLDQYALDALPDDAQHLMWLYCALVTVS